MKVPSWVLRIAIKKFLEGKTMKALTDLLAGKKTYITAVVSILIAVLSLVGVSLPGVPALDHSAAIQTIETALLGLFIRQGVAKVAAPTVVP